MPFLYFVIPGIICLIWGIRSGLKAMSVDSSEN